jgi:hypothetical protein
MTIETTAITATPAASTTIKTTAITATITTTVNHRHYIYSPSAPHSIPRRPATAAASVSFLLDYQPHSITCYYSHSMAAFYSHSITSTLLLAATQHSATWRRTGPRIIAPPGVKGGTPHPSAARATLDTGREMIIIRPAARETTIDSPTRSLRPQLNQ